MQERALKVGEAFELNPIFVKETDATKHTHVSSPLSSQGNCPCKSSPSLRKVAGAKAILNEMTFSKVAVISQSVMSV